MLLGEEKPKAFRNARSLGEVPDFQSTAQVALYVKCGVLSYSIK